MVATLPSIVKSPFVVKWERLPDDVPLEEEPVENEGQPLLAGALRESLELAGFIQPEMLILSNFGLCATVNDTLLSKTPDWLYVSPVQKYEMKGKKEQRDGYWLRCWDELGKILPWAVELVEQERLRTEQANERAEKLANYLRSQGINPDELP